MLFKEFRQFNEGALPQKPVVAPADPNLLTAQEIKKALNIVTLVKEKNDGSLKGRACVDGRKQREFIYKTEIDVSAPTVSLEGLFTSLIIDAKEHRKVVIFDVRGAFLQPELPRRDERLLLKLKGIFAENMCEINPEYEKTLVVERGEQTLYMHALRSIYGCLEAAILWYNLYLETLQKEGFVINPYDKCVANKRVL